MNNVSITGFEGGAFIGVQALVRESTLKLNQFVCSFIQYGINNYPIWHKQLSGEINQLTITCHILTYCERLLYLILD